MKKELGLITLTGITFSCVLGTLLHFLYSFTGNYLFSFISSVNESTFEHMKILFFPMLIFGFLEFFYIGKHYENFWCVKLKGTLLAVILIPVLFYTLTGILGTLSAFINVLIFYVSIVLAFLYEQKLLKSFKPCKASLLAFITLILLAFLFIIFTYYPPKLPLFLDPLTLTYGYFG